MTSSSQALIFCRAFRGYFCASGRVLSLPQLTSSKCIIKLGSVNRTSRRPVFCGETWSNTENLMYTRRRSSSLERSHYQLLPTMYCDEHYWTTQRNEQNDNLSRSPEQMAWCFYMDDCLFSGMTERAANQLYVEVMEGLKKGGLHLTKWRSNAPTFL